MSKVIDETGKQYGRLTVIERSTCPGKRTSWLCECGCSERTRVIVTGKDLRSGHTKSCGCLRKESTGTTGRRNATHGKSGTRLFTAWTAMKDRCYNKNNAYYCFYGAEGKTVCDEWLHDFQAFYDWALANGYSDDLTIDRIDTSKGYSPDNCRWATPAEQNANKRDTILIEFAGETKPLSHWAKELGIQRQTLDWRLKKRLERRKGNDHTLTGVVFCWEECLLLDLKTIRVALFSGLKEYLGIEIIRSDQTAAAPAYPYGTCKATTPATANNGTWQRHKDGTDRLMVRSIWSLSFLSADYDESVMLASKAREWLTHTGRAWLSERGIVVQSVTNIANRSNILTVDYESKHGFDAVFHVFDETRSLLETTGFIESAVSAHEKTN